METALMLRGLICISLLAIPLIARSQKVIDYPPKIVVVCLDGDTRKCMVGVKVTFRKGDSLIKSCNTDGCGRCLVLNPKRGDYFISATKPGYMQFTLAHVSIPSDQTVVLEIPLESEPNSKPANKKPGHLVATTADPLPVGNY